MVNGNTVGGGVANVLKGGGAGDGQGVRIEGGATTQQRRLGDMAFCDDDSVQPIRKRIREHEKDLINGGITGMLTMSPGDKENIMQLVKKMSRKDLEDLVHAKIVETLLEDSEAGKFRSTIVQLRKQKDKLQQKVSYLYKQVVHMSVAVKVALESAENKVKQEKILRPIKYHRTVGLQVGQVDPKCASENIVDRMLRKTSDTSFVDSAEVVSPLGTGIAQPNGPRARCKSTNTTTTTGRKTVAFMQQSPVVMDLPPLPPPPFVAINISIGPGAQLEPPKPYISLSEHKGIVISWDMPLSTLNAKIAFYEIYSVTTSYHIAKAWSKLGDIDALPLPMACTLSRFTKGCSYCLIVRAVDCHGRSGPFSDPSHILLQKTY